MQDVGINNVRKQWRTKKLGLKPETYINAGVMLYNLDIFRRDYPDYQSTLFTLCSQNRYDLPDQDAINIYFQRKNVNICALPEKYNYAIGIDGRAYANPDSCAGKILHYTSDKPWKTFFPAGLHYWKYYALAFSYAEAFQKMERLDRHPHAHLVSFMLQHHHVRKWVKRLWEISNRGFWKHFWTEFSHPEERKRAHLAA